MIEISLHNEQKSSLWVEGIDITTVSPFFDEDMEEGTFSFPLEVANSDSSNKIFGHYNSLDSNWKRIKYTGDIKYKGDIVKSSVQINLLRYTGNKTQGTYHINITGAESGFGRRISGKRLKDLALGENIIFTGTSAAFATDVMKGTIKKYPYIAFAEVYNPNYIDTTRSDYDGSKDALHNDIMNHITHSGGSWSFTTANQWHRHTVPFLQLSHVLRCCFTSVGYTVDGSIFSNADFNAIYLYNNRSIEVKNASGVDINRSIELKSHAPDMGVSDFIIAVCKQFGLVPVSTLGSKHFSLISYNQLLASANVIDISEYITDDYEQEKYLPEESGLEISWEWDSIDTMPSEKAPGISDSKVRASVKSYTELTSLSLSPTQVQGELAYVANENYFYSWDSEWSRWIYHSEGQHSYIRNSEHNAIHFPITPLMQHVYSNASANFTLHRCGVNALGSYMTNTKGYVDNAFGVRMFFIKMIHNGSYNVPVSFTHNYNSAGAKLSSFSLSLTANEGLVNEFRLRWLQMQDNADLVKVTMKDYPIDIDSLKNVKVRVGNGVYLLKEAREHIGASKEAELFLIKI